MLWVKSPAHLQMTPTFPEYPHKYLPVIFFSHSVTFISFCTSSFLPCADTTCACFPEMVQHNLWMSSYLWMYSSDCRWNTFFSCVSFLIIQSVCSEFAFSRSHQKTGYSSASSSYKFPKGLPWCKWSSWFSMRLKNVMSPYLARILLIQDLAF